MQILETKALVGNVRGEFDALLLFMKKCAADRRRIDCVEKGIFVLLLQIGLALL